MAAYVYFSRFPSCLCFFPNLIFPLGSKDSTLGAFKLRRDQNFLFCFVFDFFFFFNFISVCIHRQSLSISHIDRTPNISQVAESLLCNRYGSSVDFATCTKKIQQLLIIPYFMYSTVLHLSLNWEPIAFFINAGLTM